MGIYEELQARGLLAQVTNEEEIREMVNAGKAKFYIGFDCTADSLTAGHFMALTLMKRLQMAGNQPVALIGGGTLSVPFLLWNNLDMRKAIGTSAAIGFPIALAGCFGYIVNGWNAANLPPYSFGYIYLPSLFGIVVVSMFTAPLGARLAQTLPVPKLKKCFALLLIVIGIRMLLKAL